MDTQNPSTPASALPEELLRYSLLLDEDGDMTPDDVPSEDIQTVNISDDVESVDALSLESQIPLTYHQVVKREIAVYLRDRAHLVERLCARKKNLRCVQHALWDMKTVMLENKVPMAVRLPVKKQSIYGKTTPFPQQRNALEPVQPQEIRRHNLQPKNMKIKLQPLDSTHSQNVPLTSPSILQKTLKNHEIPHDDPSHGAPPPLWQPLSMSKTENTGTKPVQTRQSPTLVQHQSLNHPHGMGHLKLFSKENNFFNMKNKKENNCTIYYSLMGIWDE
ncbi:hypothetical protein [Pelotalea chapellei]|uniref:Uncharacterized protein n=1 Tax=Pelotalea chapellei TaxID=44671 RepID=A0ABS5U7M4_9BACT|nr:hypothetical protein [Pelotalea chapellei]MBT1071666.1 hypothetical protein [Pelotalea chapellei]